MKQLFFKMWHWVKTHKKISGGILVALLVVAGFVANAQKPEDLNIKTVEAGSVVQEVSVSGRVVSSQALDLVFERSGKITYVIKNGQRVGNGTLIAALDASEAQKTVRDAQLNLENAQIVLNKLRVSQQSNIPQLQDSITTAENNLEQAYQNGFNAVADTFLDLPDILAGIHGILYDSKVGSPDQVNTGAYQNLIDSYNKIKLLALLDRAQTGYLESKVQYDNNLESYKNSSRTSDSEQIIKLIDETLRTAKTMAQSVKDEQNILDAVVLSLEQYQSLRSIPTAITQYQTDIDRYIGQLNGHITSLTTIQNTITTNRQNLANAQRTLGAAEQSNPLDIVSQENTIKQRQSALQDAQSNLAKYFIRAPFSGVVANVDAKIGQLVSPQNVIASLVGSGKFQIETNISEADIAKIKVGNDAVVTLDAYGRDQLLQAKVIHIDPAGRVTNSVAVYKVTLEFNQIDSRILSGLTADVDIKTDSRENVVYVQSRDVITKDGKKFIKVFVANDSDTRSELAALSEISKTKTGKIVEVPVETGLKGSDGRTEIISGLQIGDSLVTK